MNIKNEFYHCDYCDGMYDPEFSDADHPLQYCGWECEEEDNELEAA